MKRVMPDRLNFGSAFAGCMGEHMLHRKTWAESSPNKFDYRVVMGYFLPSWQRDLVWTEAQKISFIESAWLGINLGTYTFNRAGIGSPLDNLLIDGQQRMNAIECYLNDEFKVFGYLWSETTQIDKRIWKMSVHFHAFITESEDEVYLRNYYNLMNFGGVAHKESDRA